MQGQPSVTLTVPRKRIVRVELASRHSRPLGRPLLIITLIILVRWAGSPSQPTTNDYVDPATVDIDALNRNHFRSHDNHREVICTLQTHKGGHTVLESCCLRNPSMHHIANHLLYYENLLVVWLPGLSTR